MTGGLGGWGGGVNGSLLLIAHRLASLVLLVGGGIDDRCRWANTPHLSCYQPLAWGGTAAWGDGRTPSTCLVVHDAIVGMNSW